MNDASNAVIAAAILAGGDSQRMGEDKAALGDNDSSLIEWQVKDLRDLSQSFPFLSVQGLDAMKRSIPMTFDMYRIR